MDTPHQWQLYSTRFQRRVLAVLLLAFDVSEVANIFTDVAFFTVAVTSAKQQIYRQGQSILSQLVSYILRKATFCPISSFQTLFDVRHNSWHLEIACIWNILNRMNACNDNYGHTTYHGFMTIAKIVSFTMQNWF